MSAVVCCATERNLSWEEDPPTSVSDEGLRAAIVALDPDRGLAVHGDDTLLVRIGRETHHPLKSITGFLDSDGTDSDAEDGRCLRGADLIIVSQLADPPGSAEATEALLSVLHHVLFAPMAFEDEEVDQTGAGGGEASTGMSDRGGGSLLGSGANAVRALAHCRWAADCRLLRPLPFAHACSLLAELGTRPIGAPTVVCLTQDEPGREDVDAPGADQARDGVGLWYVCK